MKEILEAIMLICFGLSWPESLIKNIKAKSAKSMNIYFTLLIIVGYLAGITSKIINREFTYVFGIYIFNLVIVTSNIFVYIINKKYDKIREKETFENETAVKICENKESTKILSKSAI